MQDPAEYQDAFGTSYEPNPYADHWEPEDEADYQPRWEVTPADCDFRNAAERERDERRKAERFEAQFPAPFRAQIALNITRRAA